MIQGDLQSVIELTGAEKIRYEVVTATADTITAEVRKLRNREGEFKNRMPLILTFAKNDEESTLLQKSIREFASDDNYKMNIFVDTSATPLGKDKFDQYITNLANASYHRGKDNKLADEYDKHAMEALSNWKKEIIAGNYTVYNFGKPAERLVTADEVVKELQKINRTRYYNGLEQFNVTATMYTTNSLRPGVGCAVYENCTGQYKSGNDNTKLEKALYGAWKVPEYWRFSEKKNLHISKMKIELETLINNAFSKDGKISIRSIYDHFSEEPFGFLPSNLTAFILGFLLKEYAVDAYRYSDGYNSDSMNTEKLKDMLEEIIKYQNMPFMSYKDKYIVAMTQEDKIFAEVTAEVFGIPENQCGSIEQARNRICNKMKELTFPIWCLKFILKAMNLKSDIQMVEKIIDDYTGIANPNNIDGKNTESYYALEIGKLCDGNTELVDDLKRVIKKEQCRDGMNAFISDYDNGLLIQLSDKISDNGNYLNVLKSKFDAADANWVWRKETAEVEDKRSDSRI